MSYTSAGNYEAQKANPFKLTLLLVMLPLVVILLMIIFWVVFQNIRNQTALPQDNVPAVSQVVVESNNNPLHSSLEKPSSTIDLKKQLKIVSQIQGETTLGGHYWIFNVNNSGPEKVAQPGVMVSLFDEEGKRLVEQPGYSLQKMLLPNEEAAILVFVKDVPETVALMETSLLASQPNSFYQQQVQLSVTGFSINENNKQYEIIGDVVNNQQTQAKYTRVIAVALNDKNEPIGIGNVFSTEKELMPNQVSGFKLRVGTFLVGQPHKWKIWAVASPSG